MILNKMATIVLKKGDRGENVKALQKALGCTPDGIFGNDTEILVKKFQSSHKLVADGIVGPSTQRVLGISFNNRQTSSVNDTNLNIKLLPIVNNISRRPRQIKYLVIHYTAGSTSRPGTAVSIRNSFNVKGRNASADFIIDDETIVQVNDDLMNKYCWAVGDGKGKYGVTNSNSISIEVCSTLKKGTSVSRPNHTGWSFNEAVLNKTVELSKFLMRKYNIPFDRVIRHYDATRKSCPGIVGWNDNPLYDENGTLISKKNNSSEWIKFKERLK